MDTIPDFANLLGLLRALFTEPATWRQLAIIAGGFLLALILGQFLQNRFHALIKPGAVRGIGRTAVRTGFYALVPILWWLSLLAVVGLLRRRALPTDILHFAIYLVGALALIRAGVFVLRHSFSPGSRLKAWEWALTVTIWLLVTLHILGLLPLTIEILDEHAVTLGSARISLYTATSFVLSLALLSLAGLWATNGIQALLRRSEAFDEGLKIVLGKITRFAFLTLAVAVAMITAGIDLTAFAVFGGALGVGVGLGLQRIVSNFVSGIVLALEKSIHPGDIINVGTSFGVVQGLHARHVAVRDQDGKDILIPNETLFSTEIVNWSYGDRNVRLRLPVQISYQDDPEQAMALLTGAANEIARVLKDPAPSAWLMGFGDNGINLELHIWVNDPERGINDVRSDIHRRIWHAFRAAGISFPFPQRDVHIKSTVPAGAPSSGK
ncbi:MAG: mechanosensitive ion channel [Gammaproteobacteria bacterium]|nr:mechanosensitive ion channel [Gammaproteobacteria bacterium]